MAEQTSRLTYQELIRKIAKRGGCAYYGESGDQGALVPIDTYNLDFCKDIVKDGIRMFIADAPQRGWRWRKRKLRVTLTGTRITGTVDSASATTLVDATLSVSYATDDALNGMYCYILTGTGAGSFAVITDYTASTGTITVADWLDQYGNAGGTDPVAGDTFAVTGVETVAGDKARYPLPEYFNGETAGKINYAADTSHATPIEWRDEAFLRANRAANVTTSYPHFACIRPLEPSLTDIENGSAKRRFELFLDPEPTAADVLEFPFFLTFDSLKLESGKGSAANATTITDASRTEPDDYFNGWRIEIIAGTGKGSYATVTDFVNSTGVFTVADWLTQEGAAGGTDPAANSAYIVYPVNNFLPPGPEYDEALLTACYVKLAEEDEIPVDIDAAKEEYRNKAMPKAYAADARLAPRTLGSMNKREERFRCEKTWENRITDWDT